MKHAEVEFPTVNTTNLKIGIVTARWNSDLTEALKQEAVKAILEAGMKEPDIIELSVPGCYETVWGAKKLIDQNNVDAVVCIGVLLKGETLHFEYISEAVTHGIMNLSLNSGVPIIYGILNCLTLEQAKVRSIGKYNESYDWGRTAVEMASLKK